MDGLIYIHSEDNLLYTRIVYLYKATPNSTAITVHNIQLDASVLAASPLKTTGDCIGAVVVHGVVVGVVVHGVVVVVHGVSVVVHGVVGTA
jgi:hypothetical protein